MQGFHLSEHAFLFAVAKPVPVYGPSTVSRSKEPGLPGRGGRFSDHRHLSEASAKSSRITYVLDAIPEKLDFYLVALGEE